jgi:hypothetical protein
MSSKGRKKENKAAGTYTLFGGRKRNKAEDQLLN